MYKPYYGHPTLTVRLPAWQHDALKETAKRHNTTVSAILQALVDATLSAEGYGGIPPTDPLPGQERMDV